MNIPLSPCVPENLVSRDGFGSLVSRQPVHLHTQIESDVYKQALLLFCSLFYHNQIEQNFRNVIYTCAYVIRMYGCQFCSWSAEQGRKLKFSCLLFRVNPLFLHTQTECGLQKRKKCCCQPEVHEKKVGFTVDEGKERLNPSRGKN